MHNFYLGDAVVSAICAPYSAPINKCSRLKCLEIPLSRLSEHKIEDLSSKIQRNITQKLGVHLANLDVSYNSDVTDEPLSEIIKLTAKTLKKLAVRSCLRLTGQFLCSLATHSKRIEDLDISYCTDLSQDMVAHALPKLCQKTLRQLSMCGCRQLHHGALHQVISKCESIIKSKKNTGDGQFF